MRSEMFPMVTMLLLLALSFSDDTSIVSGLARETLTTIAVVYPRCNLKKSSSTYKYSSVMCVQLSSCCGTTVIRDRGETFPPASSLGLYVSLNYSFCMYPLG